MRKNVNVRVQTGFFKRTDFKLKAAAEGLTFIPSAKGGDKITIPAANIKDVTFYEAKLKMEIQADILTDAYFASADDLHNAMNELKEELSVKIVCVFN